MLSILLAAALIAAVPNAAAHVALQSSSPAGGSTAEERPDRIELVFSGDILPLSALTVTDAEGRTTEPVETATSGGTLTATFAEPLPNGEYVAAWTIVAGDGHRLEGEFAFAVDAPEPEPTPETPGPPQEQPADDPAEPTPDDPPAEATPEPSQEEPAESGGGLGAYAPIAAVAAVVVLGAFVFLLMKPRKRGS